MRYTSILACFSTLVAAQTGALTSIPLAPGPVVSNSLPSGSVPVPTGSIPSVASFPSGINTTPSSPVLPGPTFTGMFSYSLPLAPGPVVTSSGMGGVGPFPSNGTAGPGGVAGGTVMPMGTGMTVLSTMVLSTTASGASTAEQSVVTSVVGGSATSGGSQPTETESAAGGGASANESAGLADSGNAAGKTEAGIAVLLVAGVVVAGAVL